MFFYLICTVVTIDTIGAVASNGAQGFTWLIFLGVVFFLPYVLSVAELGSAFPQEGGPYVWSRLAFGRPLAAVNSVIYWISNPDLDRRIAHDRVARRDRGVLRAGGGRL